MKDYILLFIQQTKILLWKNFLLVKRSWKLSLLRLFLPSLFIIGFFLIFHFTTRTNSSGPSIHSPYTVPPCVPYTTPTCLTIAYYPDTSETQAIMRNVANNNSPKLVYGVDIKPIQNFTSVQQFRNDATYTNPNFTQSAVLFNSTSFPLSYTILYNGSIPLSENILNFQFDGDDFDVRHPLQVAIDSAIIAIKTNSPTFQIDCSWFSLPSPSRITSSQIATLVGNLGLTFFYLGLTVTLVLGMNAIVNEKERNIRGYMRSFGMMDGPFWFSWFIEMITFHALATLLMMCFGYAFNLKFFHDGNFFANFFIFLVYGIELVSLAFFLSSLLSKTRAANILSFLIYFFGLGFAITNSFTGRYLLWLLYDPSVIEQAGNWMGGLSFIPVVLFSFAVVDVQDKTIGPPFRSFDSSSSSDSGFNWDDMTKHPGGLHYVPTVSWALTIMTLYSMCYVLLAWYLDNVISDSFGARRALYFPFQPSYWGFNKKPPYAHDFTKFVGPNQSINDEDLEREQLHGPEKTALRVVNLSKEYNRFIGTRVQAVNSMNLKCQEGTVLALLGHNGAGKTSLINILTGLSSATHGDAYIYGYSCTHDMDEIRTIMGTCPQFDIYWPELTAREHLHIALGMKIANKSSLTHEVDDKLHGVRLFKVQNHQVQTFSGGMRRRLSVALSMVGNPKIIVLDEPTTGIDPANRRYIWKLIHSIKQDKLVILTTHSMEEADRLGEKIAIMNKGYLSAVGSPLHLKSRFSSGYRINFIADMDQIPRLQQTVASMLPEAVLTAQNAGSLIYEIPDKTDQEKISKFFSFLQNSPEKVARDWGISNTTMEDVFLRVTRQ